MADRVAGFFVVLGFVWGVDRGGISTAVISRLEIDEKLLQIKSWATLCTSVIREDGHSRNMKVDSQSNHYTQQKVRYLCGLGALVSPK